MAKMSTAFHGNQSQSYGASHAISDHTKLSAMSSTQVINQICLTLTPATQTDT